MLNNVFKVTIIPNRTYTYNKQMDFKNSAVLNENILRIFNNETDCHYRY